MQTTVSIVDEDSKVGAAIAALLRAQGYKTRVYQDSAAFLDAGSIGNCVAAIVSLDLPRRGAHRILDAVAAHDRPCALVMTTYMARPAEIVAALRQGASDVLEKPLRSSDLVAAIGQAASQQPTDSTVSSSTNMLEDLLTAEELEILSLLKQGAMIKEIAAKLDISVRTVHYRKASILAKTGCKNRNEIVSRLSSLRSERHGPMYATTLAPTQRVQF